MLAASRPYPPDSELFAFTPAADAPLRLCPAAPPPPMLAHALPPGALCGYALPLALPPAHAAALAAARAQGALAPQEDRALGALLGMAVGDALGAPFEFMPYRAGGAPPSTTAGFVLGPGGGGAPQLAHLGEAPLNAFRLKPGQWTDDTAMGLCLADSLLACPAAFSPLDLLLRFCAWWEHGYNNAFAHDAQRGDRGSVGLGGTIGQSLAAFRRSGHAATRCGDELSSGNGSIMRLAAVPILHRADEAAAAALARAQSYTTHRGTEAAECAALMAVVMARAIEHVPGAGGAGGAAAGEAGEAGAAGAASGGGGGAESAPAPAPAAAAAPAESAAAAAAAATPAAAAAAAAAARKAAVLGSLAAYTALDCPSVTCLARSQAEASGGRDRDWRWARAPAGAHAFAPSRALAQPGYVGSYSMDALAMALHCVHASDSFEGAVLLAVNLRGDADSVAAVAGQIAGAIYGAAAIPAAWVAAVEQWDGGGGIAARAHALYARTPAARD